VDASWPADRAAIEGAQRFVATRSGRVVIASHNDVDGLSAAIVMTRALAVAGAAVQVLPSRRGEHVHQEAMRRRIRTYRPDALVVVDMGTRSGPIVPGLPTLVVDHHSADGGVPDGVLLVNGYDRSPVAPSSVLAYVICRHLPGNENSAWLAALGAIADVGSAAPFAPLIGFEARGTAWSKAISLLNAARRAPEDDAETALRVLQRAADVRNIVDARDPDVARLEAYRRTVQAEVGRVSRVPPQIHGDAAVLRFASAAQVHPIIATRWSRRLAPAIVVAANEGFLPGRVNFAIRSHANVDLLQWLRGLPFTPPPGAEYANGHPRATGGSLSIDDFERFMDALRARAGLHTVEGVAARTSHGRKP
jgi:single-stranded-DNA-specific exonuclease